MVPVQGVKKYVLVLLYNCMLVIILKFCFPTSTDSFNLPL